MSTSDFMDKGNFDIFSDAAMQQGAVSQLFGMDEADSYEDAYPDGYKPRILFVDDNPLFLRSLKPLFIEKYYVELATSAAQAFSQMAKRVPDVIFLDYEMPECDGREMFEKIKADPRYAEIPVVFLTAISSQDMIVKVLDLKPYAYILKPASEKTLIETIEKILREQEMKRLEYLD